MGYVLELQARESTTNAAKSPSWSSNWACYSTASYSLC